MAGIIAVLVVWVSPWCYRAESVRGAGARSEMETCRGIDKRIVEHDDLIGRRRVNGSAGPY